MTLISSDPFTPANPARGARAQAVSPVVRSRAGDIDTLRALACLALVSFHVVGNSALTGMELPMDHPLHRMNATLVDMRMPLFSFLSGYVFLVALPEGPLGGWAADRMASKARRLLVPMATVGSLFWLARAGLGTPQQSYWSIFVLPYAHFWYLQATVLIMASFVALIWASGGQVRLAALVLMLGGLVLWLAVPRPDPNVFAISDALRLSGFFAAGYLAAQARPQVDGALGRGAQRRLGLAVLILALAVGLALAQGLWMPAFGVRLGLMVGIGMASCLALLLIRPQIAALAWLGPYSYAIYLFHVFFTAGTHEVLVRLVPDLPTVLGWGVALGAGLLGPIYIHRLMVQHPITAWLFLGLRRRGQGGQPGPAPATRHTNA